MTRAVVHSRTAEVKIEWGAATHTGNRRAVNEDAFCVAAPVFAVADGMGGHQAGDLASSLAVGALQSLASRDAVTAHRLGQAIRSTSRLIHDRAEVDGISMGTTITGIAVAESSTPELVVFNVGDSRTYRWEGGRLSLVTVDHSHVQELVDAGLLSRDEAERHPDRNVITRALGIDADVDVDVVLRPAVVGQRWLACSDGLTKELTDAEIAHLLGGATAQEAADQLVAAVVSGSARDNVTVVVVEIVEIVISNMTGEADSSEITARNDRLRHRPVTAPSSEARALIDDIPFAPPPEPVDAAPEPDVPALVDEVPHFAEREPASKTEPASEPETAWEGDE